MDNKEFHEFIKKSKRLKTTLNRGVHLRICRKGNLRTIYYIDEKNYRVEEIETMRRNHVYNQKYLNALVEKIKKIKGIK